MTLRDVKEIESTFKTYVENVPEIKIILLLCKKYRKLHRLAKNYTQEENLGDARKLQEELGCEKWW